MKTATSCRTRSRSRTRSQIVRTGSRPRHTDAAELSRIIREFHYSPPEKQIEEVEIMSEADKEIYES